jgi:hypothetical protein
MRALEFYCVPPPVDVDDHASAAEYLDLLNDARHMGDYVEQVRELINSDVQSGMWCISSFLRTGSLPEWHDMTPDHIDQLVSAFEAAIEQERIYCGEFTVTALRMVQHAARAARAVQRVA